GWRCARRRTTDTCLHTICASWVPVYRAATRSRTSSPRPAGACLRIETLRCQYDAVSSSTSSETMKSVVIAPQPRPRPAAATDLATKTALCAGALAEARRLAEHGYFDGSFALVARACEILDEIDEMLLALNPERDADDFATIAKLHRELEHIQA